MYNINYLIIILNYINHMQTSQLKKGGGGL